MLITDGATGRMPRGRYPVRLADGRRIRLSLRGAEDAAPKDIVQIAGHPALVLQASEPVDQTARRIAAAFPRGHAA